MGLFLKNNSAEYKYLKEYSLFLENILLKDQYISKKDYLNKFNQLNEIVSTFDNYTKNKVLKKWCKTNKTSYKKLLSLINIYKNTEDEIKKHNDNFIKLHLIKDKAYLDNILLKDDPNIILDEEQRKVVLSDEDYTLVIAGAGAGKTTTIEAKVKYLVDIKKINPDRILIVSFTRKATEELKERFNRLELNVNIATFHSIGNTIIKNNNPKRHKIIEYGFMYKVIENYLLNKVDDEYFINKILLFFASYLYMPFDVEDISLVYKSLSNNDITTIKSDLTNTLDEYKNDLTEKRITIKDERVRSKDECRIANFLFINGIDYVYEPVYQYGFNNTTKPYCPDFLINYNGQEIYLEHFGISEDGKNNRYSNEDLELYNKRVKGKINIHKEHNTKLIYTFSKYIDGRDLIVHLEELLIKCGIKLDPKNNIVIYRELAKRAEDKYFSKFIYLICNFINRFKVCNYDFNTKFDQWQQSITSERTKLFLEIAKNCFYIYEQKKDEANGIDFEDMINDAINILDKKIKESDMLPYDYIFVDEYQDISMQRFDLCEKLSKASNAKIVAVGDDWQSIFKFSGSKIDLFTKFEEKMGYANVLKITSTYRNSQELIDIAGGFIMENDSQIKKDLKANKSLKDPVILMSYDDSYEKDDNKHGPFYRLQEAIESSLDDIVLKNGENKSVLLIGRYNFDGKNLSKLSDFFYWQNKKLKSKKYPNLDISFMTAHTSKGLGRDNVIIINGKDDLLGFPSKIEDDPIMKLVIKDDEGVDFEEERRLFYVALTRTKNRVYIITPQNRPSKFITEIKDKFSNVILKGKELTLQDNEDLRYKCPFCGYPLQKRKSNFKFITANEKLWICSNDPEVCGFLTNDLNGNKNGFSISKCLDCNDGYLIVKPFIKKDSKSATDTMLGCTNYKKDETGCNCVMFKDNFTQDKAKIKINNNNFLKSTIKKDITDLLIAIKNIYKKYPSFKFGCKSLINFLTGNEDKPITAFKLKNEFGFGIYKEKNLYLINKMINALNDLKVLTKIKNDKNYLEIILLQDELNDNQVFVLEGLFS